MRKIFIVAAKILGLFLLLGAFDKLANTGVYRAIKHGMLDKLTDDFLSALLMLTLAYLLMLKTDWFADKVGLAEKENSEPTATNRNDLFAIGLKLLGVYFGFIFSISLVKTIGTLVGILTSTHIKILLCMLLPIFFYYAAAFLIAVFLLLKTDAVIKILARAQNASWQKIVLATVITFFILSAIMMSAWSFPLMRPNLFAPSSPMRGEDNPGTGPIGSEDGPTEIYRTRRTNIITP